MSRESVSSTIVVSAINFFEGGPLSVLKDCLSYLNSSSYINKFKIVALVHKKGLFDLDKFDNIEFVEFPKSRKSYFYRLYYEYIYFRQFSEIHNVKFWLSLHDISPNLNGTPQAVYCHNPSIFNKLLFKDLLIQPTQFFFRLFYKYLYHINIHRNSYVIVQQNWIKNEFSSMFNLNEDKIIVAKPSVPSIDSNKLLLNKGKGEIVSFFYPAFPRPFKNIEVICESAQLLEKEGYNNFEVRLTIDGSENKYSSLIKNKYQGLKTVKFLGLLSREEVYKEYNRSHCLIFPSYLETWGLPISEYKQLNKPMFIADLTYAKETVGKYDFVKFFKPNKVESLVFLMKKMINDEKMYYDKTMSINYSPPLTNSWQELCDLLFKKIT